MDLDWSNQVRVLNKYVMDWRWKAEAAKVDRAQLKTSVMDFLLSRMEIGLAHANVTQKMCDAWSSTIMHTLCKGMSTVASLNRKAFCLLAGIPDLDENANLEDYGVLGQSKYQILFESRQLRVSVK